MWKSEIAVSIVIVPWKHFIWFVRDESMQGRLSGFLKNVFSWIRFESLYTLQKLFTQLNDGWELEPFVNRVSEVLS